jgi:hypothetical protein
LTEFAQIKCKTSLQRILEAVGTIIPAMFQ